VWLSACSLVKLNLMKAIDIIYGMLYEGINVPKGEKHLLLLDIDETILSPNNISVIKVFPDGHEASLSPEEYAKEDVVLNKKNGIKYDYREFRDVKKVANSILTGTPILKNLKLADAHINAGWKVGILTARGLEDTIYTSIKKWLMFRDTDGELKSIGEKISRELVHAVNDEATIYPGLNDFEKKANVIRKYSKIYDRVKFIDDTVPTLNKVRQMCKDEGIKNVTAVKAWGRE